MHLNISYHCPLKKIGGFPRFPIFLIIIMWVTVVFSNTPLVLHKNAHIKLLANNKVEWVVPQIDDKPHESTAKENTNPITPQLVFLSLLISMGMFFCGIYAGNSIYAQNSFFHHQPFVARKKKSSSRHQQVKEQCSL